MHNALDALDALDALEALPTPGSPSPAQNVVRLLRASRGCRLGEGLCALVRRSLRRRLAGVRQRRAAGRG